MPTNCDATVNLLVNTYHVCFTVSTPLPKSRKLRLSRCSRSNWKSLFSREHEGLSNTFIMNEPSHNVFCLSWNDLIESKRMFFCSWFCFVIGSWFWPGFKYLVRIQWEIQQNKWSLVLESPISDANVTDVSMPHDTRRRTAIESIVVHTMTRHRSLMPGRSADMKETTGRTVRSKIGVFLFLKQNTQNVKQSYHLRWRTSDTIESENGGTQIGSNDSKCNLYWHRYGHKWELYIIISTLYNNHIACSLYFDLSYENLNKEVK